MKKFCLMLMLGFSTTFSFATENKKTVSVQAQKAEASSNRFRLTVRPEIVGLWGMEIPNNKKCVEYYNFKLNNNVVIKSGDEWSTGIYDYQPAEDPAVEIPALILQVKYDNNQVDCSGSQLDQTGEVSQYFVKWQNPNTINFCANEKGQECFAVLRRILP